MAIRNTVLGIGSLFKQTAFASERSGHRLERRPPVTNCEGGKPRSRQVGGIVTKPCFRMACRRLYCSRQNV